MHVFTLIRIAIAALILLATAIGAIYQLFTSGGFAAILTLFGGTILAAMVVPAAVLSAPGSRK
jgi:hypothetical protein